MNEEKAGAESDGGPSADPTVVAAKLPAATRMAYECPKPKNWQDFQKACVVLFQAELSDPHAQEYGRHGQEQRGIDILGRRDRQPGHFVGVQCRRVVNPLTARKIEEDCRAALAIEAGLREIIFATTAPDSTRATDAAIAVEKKLRAEGHEVVVALYGWESLQVRIALHPQASAIFNPALYAATALQQVVDSNALADLRAQMAQVLAHVQQGGISLPPADPPSVDRSAEDPALHARIDVLRDLFIKDHQTLLAERQLSELLVSTSVDDRPWAVFRLETNLGSIAMERGREAEAAERFERAYALRPEDANAVANLALARLMMGRADEAMQLARQALDMSPRADAAIAYLLQAAARTDWQGDPETLIPKDLEDNVAAAFGLAEYLRRRDATDWAERTVELHARHPDSEELKRAAGVAVLELAIRHRAILLGGTQAVSMAQISQAADDLKVLAERYLAIGYGHMHDLLAYVSNAAILLRMADRDSEAEALLVAGLKQLPGEPQLTRLLALARFTLGRADAALAALADSSDPETAMLRAEMLVPTDLEGALAAAEAVEVPDGNSRLARLRFRMIGEIGLRIGRPDIVALAVEGMRANAPEDGFAAELLEARASVLAAESDSPDRAGPLLALAARVTHETDLVSRYELAEALMRSKAPDASAALLDGFVDLSRYGQAGELYLQALAAARQDAKFQRVLNEAAPELRDHPDILWTRAAHAWNVGDLAEAAAAVGHLVAVQPDNSGAALLKIDVLARADRIQDLVAELERPLEALSWKRLDDEARLAELLGHFGQLERAIALAYRLFLTHRDTARAWLALSGIVLGQGRNLEDRRWDMPVAAADAAVDLRFEDGEDRLIVVEADPSLRKIDAQAYEPDHPLVLELMGKTVGETVTDGEGRAATIIQLRHKYVARFHYVLEHFQTRFPNVAGFRRLQIDTSTSEGILPILEEAKARTEWIEQEQQHYLAGEWPLGLLAYRVGADPIEVGAGLVAEGHTLRVATGSETDADAACQALLAGLGKGLTLDLVAFWMARRLGALDILEKAFGPIHVPQSVLDRLRARRARFEASLADGIRGAQYEGGKLAITHIPPDIVKAWCDETADALAWLETRGKISPVIVGDDMPAALQDFLRKDRSDLFDAVGVAAATGTVLLSDDLFTREMNGVLLGTKGAWTQIALRIAMERGAAEPDAYIGWLSQLIDAGHSYLGVNGGVLARSAAIDHAETGVVPGRLLSTVTSVIGGPNADPRSHLIACMACLQIWWNDPAALPYREAATGHLLRALIHGRDDYLAMLRTLFAACEGARAIRDYMRGWVRGHFIPLFPAKQ